MKKIITLMFLLLAMGLIVNSFGQVSDMVHWTCMTPDSQRVSNVAGNVIGLTQTSSPGFAVRDYSNGPGPDQRWWPYENGAAVSWGNETDQITTRWVQFAVLPKPQYSFIAEGLSIYLGGKGTDKVFANLWYDTRADFSNPTVINSTPLQLKKDSDSLYAFNFNQKVDDGDTLYVRIYPWYGSSPSTSKYLYMRLCTIFGKTEGQAVPATALWALTNPTAGGTGFTVATNGQVIAPEEKFVNTEVNNYTGYNNSQRIRIKGNSWPIGLTNQIDTVYVEFSVSPKAGSQLTVTSLSLDIGAHSLQNMKANIWYSTDPAFANPTAVPYSTPDTVNNYLPSQTSPLVPVSLSLNEPVASGQSFFLRIYFWVHNETSVKTGKYMTLQSVIINGSTTGGAIDLPTVVTNNVVDISTTIAVSGGNVTTDGGATVTARGVCWNTTGAPTTADAKTVDGSGAGAFLSQLTGLTPGAIYYLRAYATNSAGTAYGEEKTFATLDSLVAPTVETTVVTGILVKTAQSGGKVTSWGGDSVIVRGVCWNTTGLPTVSDSKTENGCGIGSFTSILYPLTENTTYYVRAYASNSKGVGYGAVDTFTTQIPAPSIQKIVAKNGSGDYTTVQAAFNAVPDFYTGQWIILVKKGVYKEKLLLDRNKTNVILKGEDADSTILTYDDYSGKAGGTSNCYSVAIDADDFTAMDITFQNTIKNDGTFADQQGVALRVNGDRQAYYNCRLLGYQDTYYVWGGRGTGRIYMKECYIEGSVDFIFGRDIVIFDHCQIHVNREGGALTAAGTDPEAKHGLVFMDCQITAEAVGFDGRAVTSFILGRPWQGSPRTVFIRCEEPASLSPAGWSTWNVTPALYAEYQCSGPGSAFGGRISIGRQLTDAEAADFTLAKIFSKTSHPGLGYDWLPEKPILTAVKDGSDVESLPVSFTLSQNYPNPFNPVTTINFEMPKDSKVRITVHNILGERIMTLVDGRQSAGRHRVHVDAASLATGVYLYRIEAGEFQQTKKMMLIK